MIENLANQYAKDPNSPDSPSPDVLAWRDDLRLVRDLWNGQKALQARSHVYLPRHPKEELENYRIRVSRPTFVNFFGRTVRTLAGMIFRTETQLVDVPEPIAAIYTDDLDAEGTAGPELLQWLFREALIAGFSLVVVDMPRTDSEPLTLAQEQERGIRPFWRTYRKDNVVSFRSRIGPAGRQLTQLVLRDWQHVPKGRYGVEEAELYRVWRLSDTGVEWELWTRDERSELQQIASGELRGVTEIPAAVLYSERAGFMDSKPPLLDLAEVNLLHYQTASDLHHVAHIANTPILFGTDLGLEDGVSVGPNSAVMASKDATLEWVEPSGNGISSTRQLLHDLEANIAALGLGMVQRPSRAAETAEAAALKREEQDAPLAGIVGEFEDGIQRALFYTAQFLGLEDGGKVVLGRDFGTVDAVAMTRPEEEQQFGLDPATEQTEQ